MGKKTFEMFLNMLSADGAAFARAKVCAEDIDALVAYGKELGYDFGRRDVEDARRQIDDLFTNITGRKLDELKAAPDISPGVRAVAGFARAIQSNRTIAAKISGFGFDDPEAIIALGNRLGFIFDKQDLAAFADHLLPATAELSDEELELAAGGLDRFSVLAAYYSAAAYAGAIASAAAVATGKIRGAD